jgi:hypothetical protein
VRLIEHSGFGVGDIEIDGLHILTQGSLFGVDDNEQDNDNLFSILLETVV